MARSGKFKSHLGLATLLALSLALAPFNANGVVRTAQEQQTGANASGFLTVALPASGEVRVENQRGGIQVEIWDEAHAAVAVEGGVEKTASKARTRSPAQIERADALLSINVPRAAGKQPPKVELKLRLPRNARAKIFTSDGAIEVRGIPAHLSAQTISGDISLFVPPNSDAEVSAHSLNGTALFEGGSDAPPRSRQVDSAKFQVRFGAGGPQASLFSGRGTIHVVALQPESVSPLPVRETAGRGAARKLEGEVRRKDDAGEVAPAPAPQTTPTQDGPRKAPVLQGASGAGRAAAGTTDANAQDAPEEVGDDEVVRVDSELVTVNVSVVDRAQGRGLTGLTRDEFKLYEDNVEQQVEHFEAASAPFDLVLLIDLSGSTAKVTDIIRAAALRFVEAARPQDRIAVIAFAGETKIVSPLTSDRERLRSSIRAMERPFGDTRLYDATNFALDFLQREAAGQRRRAVVLMSDGLDSTLPNVTGTGSTLPFAELRSRVEEFEGLFYSIWTSTYYEAFSPEDIQAETFDLAADRMQELAEAGGGVPYEIEKLEDLAGAYERVVEDLGTVYSLSYRPTNRTRDRRWRAIRVRVTRSDAVARGKRGYFAN